MRSLDDVSSGFWLTQCSYTLGGGEQEERGCVEVAMDSLRHESEQGKLCNTHRDRLVCTRYEVLMMLEMGRDDEVDS